MDRLLHLNGQCRRALLLEEGAASMAERRRGRRSIKGAARHLLRQMREERRLRERHVDMARLLPGDGQENRRR